MRLVLESKLKGFLLFPIFSKLESQFRWDYLRSSLSKLEDWGIMHLEVDGFIFDTYLPGIWF